MNQLQNSKRIAVFLYPSNFEFETRILRFTNALIKEKAFSKIYIFAMNNNTKLPNKEEIDDQRTVFRINTVFSNKKFFIPKILDFIFWYFKVFFNVSSFQINCINPHSLSTLPLGVIISFFKGSKLIYEPHEIETETSNMYGSTNLARLIESFFIRFSNHVIVTSEGHLKWYLNRYNCKNISFVRNTPYKNIELKKNDYFREKYKIKPTAIIYIYQGIISKGRGCELILDAFSLIKDDIHIIFLGFGPGKDKVIEFQKRFPNIHYHQPVEPRELIKYTSSADIGIHMMNFSCVNHLHALPNKVMEYMNAGLPVLASNLPEMSKLIEKARSGWILKTYNIHELKRYVLKINRAKIFKKSLNSTKWMRNNNWELEQLKLIGIYKKLGFI